VLVGDERGSVTLSVPERSGEVGQTAAAAPAAAAVALCVGVTVVFGLWPAPLVDFAHLARLLF
jgi:hypothetical protein